AAGGEPPETDDGGGRVPLWRDDAARRVVAGDQRAGDRRVVVTEPMRGHGWPPLWRDDVRSAEPSRLSVLPVGAANLSGGPGRAGANHQVSARVIAVAAAASTTTRSRGARRQIAIAATAMPTARASMTSS